MKRLREWDDGTVLYGIGGLRVQIRWPAVWWWTRGNGRERTLDRNTMMHVAAAVVVVAITLTALLG